MTCQCNNEPLPQHCGVDMVSDCRGASPVKGAVGCVERLSFRHHWQDASGIICQMAELLKLRKLTIRDVYLQGVTLHALAAGRK